MWANLKDYDAIVMTEGSRLTRTEDEEEQGRIQKGLRLSETYTALAFEKSIEDAHTFGSRLIRAIKMMMDAEERKKILNRQAAGIKRAIHENRSTGGTAPYGINWIDHTIGEDGKKIAIKKWRRNEVEIATLQKAIELIKKGHSVQQVVDIFNNNPEQYPAKRKKWGHATLWSMLCRKDFYFTGKLSNGVDTGLVLFTEDEIQEVRNLVKLNRRNNGRKDMPKDESSDFLLMRMLRCECGWTLSSVTVNKARDRYYRCKRCGYGLSADKLDSDLWNEFTQIFMDKDRLLAAVNAGDFALGTEKIEQAKADLVKAEQTLEQIAERKRLIMRLLNDPSSELDYSELKATLADLGEQAKGAKAARQQALLKLSNPDVVMRSVQAARKAVVKQLDQVTELMATFSTIREARRENLPVDKVKLQVREQKRAILRSAISKGGGIEANKSGQVRFSS